ncbi:MAG: MFS transporter [Spirochaetales bacterium]
MILEPIRRALKLDHLKSEDRNASFLIAEIFWSSILGCAASFFAAFALRLGASNTDIGLLSSIPPLLVILVALPAGRFLQGVHNPRKWILGGLAVHRALYTFIFLVPFFAGLGLPLGTIAVWIFILIGLPGHLFNIGFVSLLADVVSEQRRAAVFSARGIVNNAASALLIFAFGVWLKEAPFPWSYQAMFGFGIVTSFISVRYLARIEVPARAPHPPTPLSLSDELRKIKFALVHNAAFRSLVRNTFLQSLMLWMSGPLFILYYIKTCGADEGWLGVNGTVSGLVTIASFVLWRRWMHRFGESTILKVTMVLAGTFPLLVGATTSLTLIVAANALNAFANAGVGLSHFNTLLKVMPEKSRTEYTAYWSILMNAGAFAAPMLGVLLAGWFGLAPTLLFCGAVSTVGALSFTLWPVRVPSSDTNKITSVANNPPKAGW